MLAPALTPIATTSSASSAGQSWSIAAGSRSIPTDTKNRTANRSRNGVISPAAWCDSSDSETIEPGDERAERERQAEDRARQERGQQRRREHREQEQLGRAQPADRPEQPRQHAGADDVGEREEQRGPDEREQDRGRQVAAVGERLQQRDEHDRDQVLDDHPADGRPAVEAVELARARTRTLSTTTVELMAIAAPTTIAADALRPSGMPTAAPAIVVIRIWAMAPGTATRRTGASSRKENSTPSANSRRTTPTSARSPIWSTSPTNPGVNGPMTTPARR